MAHFEHDYGPQDSRQAASISTEGAHSAPAEPARLDSWINEANGAAEFGRSLAAVLRNYRTALNGPDDRLEKNTKVQSLDTPANPSRLIQMDEASKSVHAALHELQAEISLLHTLNLVDGPDLLF